jgi:hypothetical protein
MSSDQQVPGNSETSNPIEEIVVEHPEDDPASWVSRHSRTLWGVGAVSVAVIIGVSIRVLFSKKE